MCKATIGADGRIISEPKSSIRKFPRRGGVYRPVVALDNDSSGNGYYYVTENGDDYVHVLVKPDGTEKSFTSHPKPNGVVAVSTKNNLLGVCYQLHDKFECNQYDFDGNLKHHTTITSDDKGRFYADIYNLPHGGFYVVSGECLKGEHGDCIDFSRFLLERVDANGTRTTPITLQGIDASFVHKGTRPLFYENDAKEVCYSLASERSGVGYHDSGRSELIANCFTDADLST